MDSELEQFNNSSQFISSRKASHNHPTKGMMYKVNMYKANQKKKNKQNKTNTDNTGES